MSEIRVEIDLPHSPELVWRALTDRDLLSSWFLPTDLEPREGGVFQAVPHRVPGFSGAFDIEVVGVLPSRSLLMQWRGDQMHAQVTWEIDSSPSGSLLTVRQNGFFGVNGSVRRRELRRAYQEMFEERLPATLDRLARAEPAVPRQRSGHLVAAGRAQVEAEAPSPAEPSDPWALSDPHMSAGVALPLLDEPAPLPELAESHARPTPMRRLASAFPLEQRVRAVAIAVTAALVAATAGWLWLTRPNRDDAPPLGHPPGTNGPAAGGQQGLGLPSDVPTGSAGATAGPRLADSPAASGAPVVPVAGESTAPQSSAKPPPLGSQPLTASYTTESSNGLLGYNVKVTVSVHNPGGQGHSTWAVVLTVPAKADLQGTASTVDARKDGDKVTITPKSGAIDSGATVVFDVTFGGGALLGIGSGGVTGCTVDGAACARA